MTSLPRLGTASSTSDMRMQLLLDSQEKRQSRSKSLGAAYIATRQPLMKGRSSLVQQKTLSPTLTPSMAQIADQDRTVELRGMQITLGGRHGNVVTWSRVGNVHKGWRAIAVDGYRLAPTELGRALKRAQLRARYSVTFRIGNTTEAEYEGVINRAVEQQGVELSAEGESMDMEDAHRQRLSAEKERREATEETARLAAERAEAKRLEEERRCEEVHREQRAAQELEKARKASEEALQRAVAAEAEQRRKALEDARRRAAEKERRAAEEAERKHKLKAVEEAARIAAQAEESRRAAELEVLRVGVERRLALTSGLPPRSQIADPQNALLQALTRAQRAEPGKQTKRGGPCDKCDGPHHEDDCPFFNGRKRVKHSDAWNRYGRKAKIEDSSETPATILRSARIIPQPGDGSCLFHSLAYGLQGVNAIQLRADLADFISSNPDAIVADNPIKDWVLWDSGMDVKAYAKTMRTGSRWGGAVELAVCAQMQQVSVHIYEKGPKGFTRISTFGSWAKSVNLHYGGRVHYDALQI